MSETPRPTGPAVPWSAGLCRHCLREMWRGNTVGTTLLRATDRYTNCCDGCAAWLDDHPGEDPRDRKGVHAEVIPAERPEGDPEWRRDPRRACRWSDPLAFEPDPDRDDPLFRDAGYRAGLRDARVHAAATYCADCPVRFMCRASAHSHGYEGLWGAVSFGRYRWTDLLSGEQGWTMNAGEGMRNQRTREQVSA